MSIAFQIKPKTLVWLKLYLLKENQIPTHSYRVDTFMGLFSGLSVKYVFPSQDNLNQSLEKQAYTCDTVT